MQVASVGTLLFNVITGSTLYPILAIHRWLLCTANATSHTQAQQGALLTVSFADVSMDASWGACAPVGDLESLMDSTDTLLQSGVNDLVASFAQYAVSLLSGLGEVVLSALLLLFDSTMDLMTGIVWGVQNVLLNFNLQQCTVPDYAQRAALGCVCNDLPFAIPPLQRGGTLRDGALWCVGTLDMTLLDGSSGTVYNPYSLSVLSNGLVGLTGYLQCLSNSTDPASQCPRPASTGLLLPLLLSQNVEPIAVWARCKSNFMLSMWDTGAGALFSSGSPLLTPEALAAQPEAVAWASSLSPDLLACLADPARLHVDYSACAAMHAALTTGRALNAYFVYTPGLPSPGEPPDACQVFTGLNSSAVPGSPLQRVMNDCVMDEVESDVGNCTLNPILWSSSLALQAPVAKLHGSAVPGTEAYFAARLARVVRDVLAAFDVFNRTFLSVDASHLRAALFSADGDFVHDYMDCVFLGPYTRVDMLPCDLDASLECPFYARDNASGASRRFTDCFGNALLGDKDVPFTCGSQARRALIKYYYRDVCRVGGGDNSALDADLATQMSARVRALRAQYADPVQYGCRSARGSTCSPAYCTGKSDDRLCLEANPELDGRQMGEFLASFLLGGVGDYYASTLHDTRPWGRYYNVSGGPEAPPLPAQWGAGGIAAANVGVHEGLFAPARPVVAYSPDEVYSMPPPEEPDPVERLAGSPWGLCMALLSQGALTLPLRRRRTDGGWEPLGADALAGTDLQDPSSVAALVRNLTAEAMAAAIPHFWHRRRAHAPSPSGVCSGSGSSGSSPARGRLVVGQAQVQFWATDTSLSAFAVPTPAQGSGSLPWHGFEWGTLGSQSARCPCAAPTPAGCALPPDVCAAAAGLVVVCPVLATACEGGVYSYDDAPAVWACLHAAKGLRCPELGPSDSWGLFPVDCHDAECAAAPSWLEPAGADLPYPGIRLVVEGRAGLRLPNLAYVNATFNTSLHHGAQARPAWAYAQRRCFPPDQLTKTQLQDAAFDAAQDVLGGLVPAAQLLFESPATSACTRYLLETARAAALAHVSEAAAEEAAGAALIWSRRCHAKVRHLAACVRLGVYGHQVPPPPAGTWSALAARRCDAVLDPPTATTFMTQWCVVVDTAAGVHYDGALCLAQAGGGGDTQTASVGQGRRLRAVDLTAKCQLWPQPLAALLSTQVPTPFSTLWTVGPQRLSAAPLVELSPTFGWSSLASQAYPLDPGTEQASHVLDWWPPAVPPPVGFHVTAAMAPDELAPMVFDTQYAYDPTANAFRYVHSALRDPDLLYNTAGGGGLCRAHSVGMPLFDTNTNRMCTRSPLQGVDSPSFPVMAPRPATLALPSLGPYAEPDLDGFVGPEACAASHADVPWIDPTATAGTFPGLGPPHLTLDTFSGATYSPLSRSFPPTGLATTPLSALFDAWGDGCQGIEWAPSPPCGACPYNTVCLPLNATAKRGTGACMSTAAYRQDRTRAPCFRTDHCADGLVCLADGGCAPLTFHVWNAEANDLSAIEFAVLADDCGFASPVHPQTQSMRGASPWEQVPDLLSTHGMCSHREWFAYRNALLRNDVCPRAYPYDDELRACNASAAAWPWIQMRSDGSPIVGNARGPTMDQSPVVLQTMAHPCDAAYLHHSGRDGSSRLQVCSGVQGRPVQGGGVYGEYSLARLDGGWDSARVTPVPAANTTYWMRTYDEPSGLLHVGALDYADAHNTTLGFLGADADSANAVAQSLSAEGGVAFFRCASRIACTMPEYTFNGAVVDRLDPTTLTANLSELSLRRCGAIGALVLAPSLGGCCLLDHALFPLFALLVWGNETEGRGCQALWPPSAHVRGWARVPGADAALMSGGLASLVAANPTSVFCTTTPAAGGCLYQPRPTPALSADSTSDSVAALTGALNALLLGGTAAVQARLVAKGVQTAYEDVNLCYANLYSMTFQLQAQQTAAYGSGDVSGHYMAFVLSLYEFPQQWYHHALLAALLGTSLDRAVDFPDTSTMLQPQPAAFGLWSTARAQLLCAPQRVAAGSTLLHMVCAQAHPAYTFAALGTPGAVVDAVQSAILTETHLALADAALAVRVECFSTAAFACSLTSAANQTMTPCQRALAAAYSPDCNPSDYPPPDWTPCHSPELYTLGGSTSVALGDLSTDIFNGQGLADFLQGAIQAIQGTPAATAVPFAEARWADTAELGGGGVPVVEVLPVDVGALPDGGYFDVAGWSQAACVQSLPPDNLGGCIVPTTTTPSSSSGTAPVACLYPADAQPADQDRYFVAGAPPALVLTYANGTQQSLAVCGGDGAATAVLQQAYDLDEDGNLLCAIASVDVPAGVLVTALAGSAPLAEWRSALAAAEAHAFVLPSSNTAPRACAWLERPQFLQQPLGWWPSAVFAPPDASSPSNPTTPLSSGFKVDFTTMPTWWPGDGSQSAEWESQGCGTAAYVCGLQFRLTAGAQCTAAAARAPDCDAATPSTPRAFRLRQDADHTLWTCAACTPMAPLALSSATVGCRLTGAYGSTPFTPDSLARAFPFLYAAAALEDLAAQALAGWPGADAAALTPVNGSSNPDAQHPMLLVAQLGPPTVGSPTLATWNQGRAPCGAAGGTSMWLCFEAFDPTRVLDDEAQIWRRVLDNPTSFATMGCQGQRYDTRAQAQCNAATDVRRQRLAAFVDTQYRQTDGVWLQQVAAGQATAWQANVASPAGGRFTLVWAASDRSPPEVLSRWVLGDGPCAADPSWIADRICAQTNLPGLSTTFEPMHPWVGGDYNPFLTGQSFGLDECPYAAGSGGSAPPDALSSMCPCACSPPWACGGLSFNYSREWLDLEFPTSPLCQTQSYSTSRVQRSDDAANLCSTVRKYVQAGTATCTHRQGALGQTAPAQAVTTAELHARTPLSSADSGGGETLLPAGGGVWAGGLHVSDAGPAFLQMPGSDLHPAHVAFGLDLSLQGTPLKVQALALLPSDDGLPPPHSAAGGLQWVETLSAAFRTELDVGDAHTHGVPLRTLYPQLLRQRAPPPAQQQDWSCPVRQAVFLGGSSPTFAPVAPDPVLAEQQFGLGGVHPFIQPETLHDALAQYNTTNGACFYLRSGYGGVPLTDLQNPCGLKGLLVQLATGGGMLSTVQDEPFAQRCMDVVDTPDLGGTLRSGETLLPPQPTTPPAAAPRGLLHRLSPFVLRVRGDAAQVQARPGTSTQDDGGDCHLGRAVVVPHAQVKLQGQQCALAMRNATHVRTGAQCPSYPSLTLARVAPPPLEALLAKTGRTYRAGVGLGQSPYPSFTGPGEGSLTADEVSYGLLYSASPWEALASDLSQQCAATPGCQSRLAVGSLGPSSFLDDYTSGRLAASPGQNGTASSGSPPPSATAGDRDAATRLEMGLWTTPWAWSFLNKSAPPVGLVDQQRWIGGDRAGACNASLQALLASTPDALLSSKVQPISLCAPPPTGSLQVLCDALQAARQAAVQLHCERLGACLSDAGMFYVPYMWSTANQEFVSASVDTYYQSVTTLYGVAYSDVCPASTPYQAAVAKLSAAVNANCPAMSMEVLKSLVTMVKKAGHDLLHMAFDWIMFVGSILGAFFGGGTGNASFFGQQAIQYLFDFFDILATDMMAILDSLVQAIFGQSKAGQVIMQALSLLCQAFDDYIRYFLSPVFCYVVLEPIVAILRFLQGLTSLGGGNSVSDAIGAIIGVLPPNVGTCQDDFNKLIIQCPATSTPNTTAPGFQTQPIATQCWANAGGGTLTGAQSLLTCTVSDTCAQEPLSFAGNSGQGLVQCAACPLDTGFGCDSYLKRCTCGAAQGQQRTACVRNSDCSTQVDAPCAVASTLQGVRSAFVDLPCGQCGTLGMQPICAVDGQEGAAGLCACAQVQGALLTCTATGQATHVLGSTQQCAVVLDTRLQAQYKASAAPAALVVDFDQIAVTLCLLGAYDNLCLAVNLPLSGSPTTVATPLVVLLGMLMSGGGGGRRLLRAAWGVDDTHLALINRSRHRSGGGEGEEGLPLFNALAVEEAPACLVQGGGRAAQKRCIHCRALTRYTQARFAPPQKPQQLSSSGATFCDTWTALTAASSGADQLHYLAQQWLTPHDPHLGAPALAAAAVTTKGAARLLLAASSALSLVSDSAGWNASYESPYAPPSNLSYANLTCTSLDEPIQAIVDAFWVTVAYYRGGQAGSMAGEPVCNASGLLACGQYRLPPPLPTNNNTSSSPALSQTQSILVNALLYAPTAGYGGQRVLDAALSPMAYDEAVQGGFVTGQRLVADLSTCNFTALTLGPDQPHNLLAICVVVGGLFALLTLFCSPCTMCTWMVWALLFPMAVVWAGYNISPLCFPMIPPRLPIDLAAELQALLPTSLDIPSQLVRPECTTDGAFAVNGSSDPAYCYLSCSDPPFLFLSWQDTATWWLCELGAAECQGLAIYLGQFGGVLFQDMRSSAEYYTAVQAFSAQDSSFVQAHRLCAVFSLHQITVWIAGILFAVLVAPHLVAALMDIFMGSLILLMDMYEAEL